MNLIEQAIAQILGTARRSNPNKLSHLDSLEAAQPYKGAIRDDIIALKYHGRRDLAKKLAKQIAPLVKKGTEGLVPIPMHPAVKRERGLNHAEELAQEVSKLTGIPMLNLLAKCKNNRPQSGLNPFARAKNVKGCFSIRTNPQVKRVTLIDDITVSGTTLEEAAGALKRAGVERVDAVVLAKSEAFEEIRKRLGQNGHNV